MRLAGVIDELYPIHPVGRIHPISIPLEIRTSVPLRDLWLVTPPGSRAPACAGASPLAKLVHHFCGAQNRNDCAQLWNSTLAATLARAAFGADTAGTGPNHFRATTMRTTDSHEHAPESFANALSMRQRTIRCLDRAFGIGPIGNDVDNLLFRSAG